MALVNQAKREINAKIVYFGPALAGKATNLKYIFGKLKPEFRGTMKGMKIQGGRMLFFDFIPPGDASLLGYRIRLHVYTLSGEGLDNSAWKMVLKGADGVVFVADAGAERTAANVESQEQLKRCLEAHGPDLPRIPTVYQYNKGDRPDALSKEELDQALNPQRQPSFNAVSQQGEGVLQTLLGLVKLVLRDLRKQGMEGLPTPEEGEASAPGAPAPAERSQAPAPGAKPPLAEPAAPAPEPAPVETVTAETAAETAGIASGAASLPSVVSPAPAAGSEDTLSLEISAEVALTGSCQLHLPLTIRAGDKTKTVTLKLDFTLEEG